MPFQETPLSDKPLLAQVFASAHARREARQRSGAPSGEACPFEPEERAAAERALAQGCDPMALLRDPSWANEAHDALALSIELGEEDFARRLLALPGARPRESAFRFFAASARAPSLGLAVAMHEKGEQNAPKNWLEDLLTRFCSAIDALGAQWALGLGADPNAKGRGSYGRPHAPLFVLANGDGDPIQRAGLARTLVLAGADVNARDQDGATPLHWAMALGRLSLCRFYLENGADLSARDEDNSTPLDWLESANLGADAEHGMWPAGAVESEGAQNDGDLLLRLRALPAQLEAEALRLCLSENPPVANPQPIAPRPASRL